MMTLFKSYQKVFTFIIRVKCGSQTQKGGHFGLWAGNSCIVIHKVAVSGQYHPYLPRNHPFWPIFAQNTVILARFGPKMPVFRSFSPKFRSKSVNSVKFRKMVFFLFKLIWVKILDKWRFLAKPCGITLFHQNGDIVVFSTKSKHIVHCHARIALLRNAARIAIAMHCYVAYGPLRGPMATAMLWCWTSKYLYLSGISPWWARMYVIFGGSYSTKSSSISGYSFISGWMLLLVGHVTPLVDDILVA